MQKLTQSHGARRRVLSVLLTLAMLLTLLPAMTLPAQAAMPTATTGAVNDGVDFAALSTKGNGIYYGAYDHAVSIAADDIVTKEGSKTPVLWRVMGEEASDGYITMLSEYVLDAVKFRTNQDQSNANVYEASELKIFLADMAADTGNFLSREQSNMAAVNVVTKMYDSAGNEKTGLTQGTTYPVTSLSQKLYPAYGKSYDNGSLHNNVYWDAAGSDAAAYLLSADYAGNKATLKGTVAVNDLDYTAYWLRSPSDTSPSWGSAARGNGVVSAAFDVDATYGVRPLFKLNPSNVLFASEIASGVPGAGQMAASENYIAGSGTAKNYKLTVLNPAYTIGSLAVYGNLFNGASAHPVQAATPGSSVSVTASDVYFEANKLVYKIVDSDHNIVGYGQSGTINSLAVAAKKLDGGDLNDGDYIVYVWAQQDHPLNSNEGGSPSWFTLKVTSDVTVKVNSGSTDKPTATAGETVTIIANAPPAGKPFRGWNIISGEVTFTNSQAAVTTFVMPEMPVEVSAVYGQTGDVSDGAASRLAQPGDYIYYGAYAHTLGLDAENAAIIEEAPTPILWRVMGEEADDGYVTALSEYTLLDSGFRSSRYESQAYHTSNIKYNLELMAANTDVFPAAEQSGMASVDVVTKMYADNGDELTGRYSSVNYPYTTAMQKLYIPYGVSSESVYWDAASSNSSRYLIAAYNGGNIATFKSESVGHAYWLRSPKDARSYDQLEYYGKLVNHEGYIGANYLETRYGVRPIFKLDPSNVIFASEIVSGAVLAGQTPATAGYATGTDGHTNYKLTILNPALVGGAMKAEDSAFDAASAHPTASTPAGNHVNVTASGAAAGTKLTYKIVDKLGNLVGYGQGANNAALTVTAADLTGARLAEGDYTIYVWAQKDSAVNSHEGSLPQWFTLRVTFNGSVIVHGGSADKPHATAGETVTITAGAAPVGTAFQHWTVDSGNVTLGNLNVATTSFIMPETQVELGWAADSCS